MLNLVQAKGAAGEMTFDEFDAQNFYWTHVMTVMTVMTKIGPLIQK